MSHADEIPGWVRLPGDTVKTCDITAYGSSPHANDDRRCGKPAAWVRASTCGCGAIHIVVHQCHEHRVADAEKALDASEKRVKKLIALVRHLDHDLRTDEEALLTALGIDRYPRPEPDDLWRKNNAH